MRRVALHRSAAPHPLLAQLVAVLVPVAGLLVTESATPQALPLHGQPRPERPIHTRMQLADLTALIRVEAVEPGRIRVRNARTLNGEQNGPFEIKRSPSRPPPLEAGDHALVFLQGARSPYLLIDEPRETIELESFDDWPRWKAALVDLRAAAARPEGTELSSALLALYRSWLEGPADDLRRQARIAIAYPEAPFHPLSDAFLAERARAAMDASRSASARIASAAVAAVGRHGVDLLLAETPGDPALPEVVTIALRAGGLGQSPLARDAVVRSLRHPNPAVRRAALGFSLSYASDPAIRELFETLASEDPDDEVKAMASNALRRSQRRR